MKKIALIAALAFMLGSANVIAADKKAASEAINAAVKEVNAAAGVHYEWRDSYKTIGKAKKAYKKGDYAKAMKLANKARKQGELAQIQAKAEAHATTPKYVYE
jgi:hypothetical protein